MTGQRAGLRRNLVSSFAALGAFLPLYLIDPASPATWALVVAMAPLSLVLSASAGVAGAAGVATALVLLRVTRRGIGRARRGIEFLVCALVLALVLGGGAHINEHVVKPLTEVPRPNLALLAAVPSADAPLLGMSAEAFYGLGDKAARRVYLTGVLAAPDFEAAFPLPPGMKDHWLHETGFSFPSGHSYAATLIAAFFLSLGFGRGPRWRTRLGLALPVWAFLVACSRNLLLVHSANDVIFGALLGALVGCTAGAGTGWLFRRLAGED